MRSGGGRGARVIRITSLAGMAALLGSLWAQGPMWWVELGLAPVAPGGGEYMVALFFGLPALLLALALLGVAVGGQAGAPGSRASPSRSPCSRHSPGSACCCGGELRARPRAA